MKIVYISKYPDLNISPHILYTTKRWKNGNEN